VSVVSATMRTAVEQRAGHRCEYCHLPTRGQVAPFPVDHLIPLSQAGPTVLDNLALACPICNGHKWKYTAWQDPETGESVPLFNPRKDVWAHHFEWSREQRGILVGKTPCGRATLARLQINRLDLVITRQLLTELGLFPELNR
jgi:HNH endonuclease